MIAVSLAERVPISVASVVLAVTTGMRMRVSVIVKG